MQIFSHTGLNSMDYIVVCGDISNFVLIEQQSICGTKATDCVKIVLNIMQLDPERTVIQIPDTEWNVFLICIMNNIILPI